MNATLPGEPMHLGTYRASLAGQTRCHRTYQLGTMEHRHYLDKSQPRSRWCSKKGGPASEPTDHALGRSRGGFGTKIHLLSDGNGIPLAALLTGGQAHEAPHFAQLLESVAIRRSTGHMRRRPQQLAGDKAYHAQHIRQWLRQHGIRAVIPPKQYTGKRPPGRPITYDKTAYRQRNVIERRVPFGRGWLKERRSLATRFEKLAVNYMTNVQLAFIQRYLRLLAPAS
jgi:transposase